MHVCLGGPRHLVSGEHSALHLDIGLNGHTNNWDTETIGLLQMPVGPPLCVEAFELLFSSYCYKH